MLEKMSIKEEEFGVRKRMLNYLNDAHFSMPES